MGHRDFTYIERSIAQLADRGMPYLGGDALWAPPSMRILGAAVPSPQRLQVWEPRILNRSGASVIGGFAARLHTRMWTSGTWTAATGTVADNTGGAQNATDDDVPLETTTANDGYIVAAYERFNMLALRLTTASVGAGAVRVVEYSQAGGSWATLSNPIVAWPGGVIAVTPATKLVWWAIPTDWAPVESGHYTVGGSFLDGKFAVRLRATTAPTTAALAGSLSVFLCQNVNLAIADDTDFRRELHTPMNFDVHADGLYAVLSAITDPQTVVSCNVKVLG
ncbi:hypothetical protein [Caudoviricetes sp.]|nr:hypothetical protein [Caudoviricetes sp.]